MHLAESSKSTVRYLVLLPSVKEPVGGVNILLWLVEALNDAGYCAATLQGDRSYKYNFRNYIGDRLYSPALNRVLRRDGCRAKVWRAICSLLPRSRLWSGSSIPVWQPQHQDVLIVPEFMYPEALATFSDKRYILAVQNSMSLMRAKQRWHSVQPEVFSAVFSISQACAKAVGAVFGMQGESIRLPVCHPGLTFNREKKLQIAIMPRKRSEEAKIIMDLIAKRPDLAGIPLVIIDQVSIDEAQRLIRDSLIFLSLSDREGFGLPPAEAMATGSLVIGYTGVGGEEYFTFETGFPIPDGDIVAFVDRLGEVVTTWRASPAGLEKKRLAASEFIWTRYDEHSARQSLLDLWGKIDAELK